MILEKGKAGYITARKRAYGLYALLEFAVVAIVFATGYVTTRTRLNLFTVAAVVCCLPAAKMLVEFIAIFPYQTIDQKLAEEIRKKAALLTVAYDLVITSKKKIMPIDVIVISNKTVFGYTQNPKTDTEEAAAYLKEILSAGGYTRVTVKLFSEYVPFLSRVEGLNNMIEVNHMADKELEENIRKLILTCSM